MRRTYYLNNLLSKRHFLLAIALWVALTLTAQESCYEKYMREHNMVMPTIDADDDSYDELKKEVIARQIMREEAAKAQYAAEATYRQSQPAQAEMLFQPIWLAIDTLTGTCHLITEDGTILADAHLALVDSTWYMWLSVDPLADKNIANTPYLYCGGNPIMMIDPDGRDIYNFDENGNYVGKEQQDGAHYGTMIYNGKSICFSFADPIHDPQAIDDGLIDKLQIVSDSELMQILNESGVFNSMNQENKYSFILNESNASRITAEGRMDYVISGIYRGASIVNYSNYLFVTNNQGKYSAHNTYNFGNYLWGAGAAALGIPYPIAWFGSNANNFLFDTSSRWHLDSRDDQYSIKQGFIWLQNRK